ncbi:MAG TPA: lysylphosphatidylglycerol synthase transmembrane domain-containing protein [Vicinamibacterales bacterium]|nr:lysylphosphatidylglycerol synthase transmembrane domain-containing protein [Vicinamibacterales bacterium]
MALAQPERSPRHDVLLAVKIAVSLVLLVVLFSKIDVAQLWQGIRDASFPWLAVALALYFVNVVASMWRWHLLLAAQSVVVQPRRLLASFLVANFFNNFLPSNVGGDVIRITDSAKYTKSKTVATIVVLMDRGIGVMALILIAAIGATAAVSLHPSAVPIWPAWLWAGFLGAAVLSAPAVLAPAGFGRLLQPLTVIHPEWVGGRIENLTGVLARFRARPGALAGCFVGALFVQATMVVFYSLVAYALHIDVPLSDLGVIVPISFVVQLLPVSVNGFGVREATFSLYFQKIGQPIAAALLLSLVGQALIMLFSVTGAAVYVSRSHNR